MQEIKSDFIKSILSQFEIVICAFTPANKVNKVVVGVDAISTKVIRLFALY